MIYRVDVGEYGGVITDGEAVVELVEGPQDDRDYRLNVGVYCFEQTVFEAIRRTAPRAGEHLLVDAIDHLIEIGNTVHGVESDGFWAEANYPWDLLGLSQTLVAEDP